MTAAILMYARPGIKSGGGTIRDATIGRALHDDAATPFIRADFDPVSIVAVEHEGVEAHSSGDNQIGINRRFPRAIRGYLLPIHNYCSFQSVRNVAPIGRSFEWSMPCLLLTRAV